LSEKYLKKLIGKTDIEDALKRLDKLTNEEVRMVTAQVLEATHTVDDKLGRVEDKVLDVDNKVAGVDDRVAGVDGRMARVDERVAVVDDRVAGVDERVAGVDKRVADVDHYVKAIDDKVAVVIDGAQPSLISQQENIFNSDVPRGKRDKGSHTTSGRRHGPSEKLVIFFALALVCRLKHPYRESITTEPSQMALSAGSVN
jgi:archaellum component FlaC